MAVGYLKHSIISLMWDTRIKYATLLGRSLYLYITVSVLWEDSLISNLLNILEYDTIVQIPMILTEMIASNIICPVKYTQDFYYAFDRSVFHHY